MLPRKSLQGLFHFTSLFPDGHKGIFSNVTDDKETPSVDSSEYVRIIEELVILAAKENVSICHSATNEMQLSFPLMQYCQSQDVTRYTDVYVCFLLSLPYYMAVFFFTDDARGVWATNRENWSVIIRHSSRS